MRKILSVQRLLGNPKLTSNGWTIERLVNDTGVVLEFRVSGSKDACATEDGGGSLDLPITEECLPSVSWYKGHDFPAHVTRLPIESYRFQEHSKLTTCDCDFPWWFRLKALALSPFVELLSLRCEGIALCAAAMVFEYLKQGGGLASYGFPMIN